jgi:hypothetical protein
MTRQTFPPIRLRPFGSARRLVLIGVLAIAAIGATVAWMIWRQRDAALADAWESGNNLARVLAEQNLPHLAAGRSEMASE